MKYHFVFGHSGSFYLRTSTLTFITNKHKNKNSYIHIKCICGHSGVFYLKKSTLKSYEK